MSDQGDDMEHLRETSDSPARGSPGYGFFCKVIDPPHFKHIRERINRKGYFTDRVLFDRVSVRLSDLALIVSPAGILHYAVHIRPTKTGTTGTRGFRGESPVELGIGELELGERISPEFWSRLKQGFIEPAYRPSSDEWQELWSAIKDLRPDKLAALRRLEQLRFDEAFDLTEQIGTQRYFEKDAVGVALQVERIAYHGVFADLSDGFAKGQSLIESLCGNATEDVQIAHDVHTFPAFVKSKDLLHACEFRQGDRALTVYNVNRRRAEAALGVDLIYHNHEFSSFTFVQYKMLDKSRQEWLYRPDEQFRAEADRMRRARSRLTSSPGSRDPKHYRLAVDPFYFKFCRRIHQKVNAGTLVHGHYLTLSHIDLLLAGPAKGSRGGMILSPSTMQRWLTRTDFASLIANGWVGTANVSESEIEAYIEDALVAGRSVVVAVGRGAQSTVDEGDGHLVG